VSISDSENGALKQAHTPHKAAIKEVNPKKAAKYFILSLVEGQLLHLPDRDNFLNQR
jgi:hypothetical protein